MKKRTQGVQPSLFLGCAVGSCVAVLFALLLSAVEAIAILNGAVPYDLVALMANVGVFVSALLGCFVSSRLVKGQYAIISAIVFGLTLLLQLMVNVVFMNGSFGNLLLGVMASFLGALISCCINLILDRGVKQKRKRFNR